MPSLHSMRPEEPSRSHELPTDSCDAVQYVVQGSTLHLLSKSSILWWFRQGVFRRKTQVGDIGAKKLIDRTLSEKFGRRWNFGGTDWAWIGGGLSGRKFGRFSRGAGGAGSVSVLTAVEISVGCGSCACAGARAGR